MKNEDEITHVPLKPTDTHAFLDDLDGGGFSNVLGFALSEVADAVIHEGAKGKVTITLSVAQVGGSHSVMITHKIATDRPTSRGKAAEEMTAQTLMSVNAGGRMTYIPEAQGKLGLEVEDYKPLNPHRSR